METPEDEGKTRLIRRPSKVRKPEAPAPRESAGSAEETGMTRLIGPPTRAVTAISRSAPATTVRSSEDPVVGWLVIVKGPGRGNARQLGYGQNSLGRDHDERVCLDFGDESVSRKKHCFVIYEPRARAYTVRPGDGANLAYLNGTLLSEPRPLQAADLLELGETTLRFVPLCGPAFEWQEPLAPPIRKN